VIVREWEHHKLIMSMIRDILMYMDKTYCTQQKLTFVYEKGLLLFRDVVLKHGIQNEHEHSTSNEPPGDQRLKALLLENVHR
jgi:cullin 3